MGLDASQLALRKTGIGASESPCLVGLSPFGNAISVFAEKMGLHIREETPAMDLGLILEDGARQLYEKRTGRTTAHFGTIRHQKYPWMLATPDLAIYGERRVAQIKLVGHWMAHHWKDGVPPYVECQIQHELEVADADVGDAVALIGGTDFRVIEVHRDRSMGADLVSVCHDFWKKHIVTGEMPDPDGSDEAMATIRERFKVYRPEYHLADKATEVWALRWLDADRRMREAEKDQKVAEQHVKVAIGDHEGIEGESFRATWKASKKGTRIFLLKALACEAENAA